MWRLVKKDLKELVNLGLIATMVFWIVFYSAMGKGFERVKESATKRPSVVVVGESNYIEILEKFANLKIAGDEDTAMNLAKETGASAIIVFPPGFDEAVDKGKGKLKIVWILKGVGMLDLSERGSVGVVLDALENSVKEKLLKEHGLSLSDIENVVDLEQTTILKGKVFEGHGVDSVVSALSMSTFLTPMLVTFVLVYAGSVLIGSMAMERENKTLETLLTLPVRRSHIVLSKLIASSIVGLLMTGAYMLGFAFYMSSASWNDLSSRGVSVISRTDYVVSAASLLVSLYVGLALCFLLGLLAKDAKSAQMLSFPVTLLAFVPMVVGMFKDLDTIPGVFKILMFVNPFTHPVYSLRLLAFDMEHLVVGGIVYNSILSVVLTLVLSRIFRSDVVVLGVVKSKRSSKSV